MLDSWIPSRNSRTYSEDLKYPDEVLLPTRDLILIVLGQDESKDRPPFAPFGDPPLDLRQGPTIETSVSRSLKVCSAFLAHAVRVPIAPRTC